MRFLTVLVAALIAAAQIAAAETYSPPNGCVLQATVRSKTCETRHISACASQLVADIFKEDAFYGRKQFEHPTLFTLFTHKSGLVIGHDYGEGAPRWGETVKPGDSFAYSRSVIRNFDASEAGDEGMETMRVAPGEELTVAGRRFSVLPLEFEVIGADGDYRLVERAYVLENPRIPLGGSSQTFDGDGAIVGSNEGEPVSISLPGDPGFGVSTPPAHCGTLSS